MKLLLDTHTFIWWDNEPARLSTVALAACRNPGNTLHPSLGSVWELQIKLQLGKVQLPKPLGELLHSHETNNALIVEPISRADILALSTLPAHHRDPFDRILIAQAKRGDYRLVTCDPEIGKYDVEILW